MIAAGKYRARAVSGDWGYTGNGNEQVAVLFQLADTGEKITWYGFMTDKTADRTIESLLSCGVTDLQSLSGIDANEVELDIAHDTYNGNTKAKVNWVNRLGSGGVAMKSRMGDTDKARFAARFQGQFLKKKAEQGGTNDSTPAGGKSTGTDDDVPF